MTDSYSGWIYIVESEIGFYKIGYSHSNPIGRVASIKSHSPVDVRLLYLYWVKNVKAVEKAIHYRYANKRVRAEWFDLEDEDLLEIERFVDKRFGIEKKLIPPIPKTERKVHLSLRISSEENDMLNKMIVKTKSLSRSELIRYLIIREHAEIKE